MLNTVLLIATAVFLRQLYRPGLGRSRQKGIFGFDDAAAAAGSAATKAAAAAAKKAAATGAAKAGASKAAAGSTKAGAAKVAPAAKTPTAAKATTTAPTSAPVATAAPQAPSGGATATTGQAPVSGAGGTTGIVGSLLGKSEKATPPPAIAGAGSTTPAVSQGAGTRLFDSNKAAGGDTQAALAQALQQAASKIQSAPISRSGLLTQAATDIAVGQATAPAQQQQSPPQIGTLAVNTPAFAEGGVVSPGTPFIAGEAGGAPEVITPAPDGSNVVTPITPEQSQAMMGGQGAQTQPSVAPQGRAATQPTATPTQAQPEVADFDPMSILGKLGDIGIDFAIASALGNPALVINLQQQRSEQRKFLASQALQNPSILTSSPDAAQAYEAIFGEGSALQLLKENAPGAAARRQAISLGMNILPPGTLDADGKPAPGTAEQINKWAFDHEMDFRLGSDGLQLNRNAPSHEEISTALSYSTWGTYTQAYRDLGMEPLEASRTAAKQILVELSKKNFVIPPRLRDLAMEDITSDMDAKHAAALAEATSTVELAFKPGLAAAGAVGTEIGQARGAAAAAVEKMDVVGRDGMIASIPITQVPAFVARMSEMAEVISGIPGAVDMGTNPSKTLVNSMALKGMDIIEDSAGNMIALPIGNKFGGRKITGGQLASGPESAARLKEIVRILDKVEAIPNVLDSFPSEKTIGRVRARGAGYLKSWVRNLTDSPGLLTGRGAVRRMGFHMARLAGSNSQLSDAERADAGAIYQPFRDGTGTREQIAIGFKWARDHVANKLEGLRYPGIKPQAAPPTGGSPVPASPAGAFVAPSQDLSEFVLTLPDGSTVVAERVQ